VFFALLRKLSILGLLYFVTGLTLIRASDVPEPVFNNVGSLTTPRWGHTATLLTNGMILAAGGKNESGSLATAELFDPATGVWKTTGGLSTARSHHTATLLRNGNVLIVGGYDAGNGRLGSSEVYDSASETWIVSGSLHGARAVHTATLLASGSVLVAGGDAQASSAELYHPISGTWGGDRQSKYPTLGP
jgi:large repetitive protein